MGDVPATRDDPTRRRTTLPDGTPVRLRPLEPADRDALVAAFARLSDESRYRRFLSPLTELPPPLLHRLVETVDGVDHVALVLLAAADAESETAIGIGRFVRDAAAPDRAEVAVTVDDAWQGRGAGTVLAEALADAARERGIDGFTATVSPGNAASLALLAHSGRVIERRSAGPGALGLVVDLTAVPARHEHESR